MHDDASLVEARLLRTIRDRLRPALHGPTAPVRLSAWEVPGPVTDPVPTVDDARSALAAEQFRPFPVGDTWGKAWGTVWFRIEAEVPVQWSGRTVELAVSFFPGRGAGFQSEGLVFRTERGGPVRGIHPEHQFVPVDLVTDDGRIDVLVEAAANPVIGMSHRPTAAGDPATSGDTHRYRLDRAELAVRNDETWHLHLDLEVLRGLLGEFGADDPRRFDLLRTIDAALDAFDPHDLEPSAARARAVLAPWFERAASDHAHRTSAIGHAHIDSAWLWPLRETRRKCVRTFSSAVTLMDAYPEYRFVCSQAAQYAWVEQDQPELFERIRSRVAEGRFVPVGAMWVEADANLPSGESLARQFVWGTRYFEDRFGIGPSQAGNRTCWIPDVFGYAGNLPQIMAEAGCDSFLTQKLSWNQTNDFPHHTFDWEGIDGTRVLTHFPPVDTYNGEVTPTELAYSVRNFRDKGRSGRSVYLFGHGDGGGGPTREMLERARRISGPTGEGIDGLPRFAIEAPERFFDQIRDEDGDAPVWRGELYFEMHRGTYTSQARTKWGNRRGELALRSLELWTSPAAGVDAPLADLERMWKELLLHQFHDIIPGSSIAWVHDDTEAAHAALLEECERRIADALDTGGDEAVIHNAAPVAVSGPVRVPADPGIDDDEHDDPWHWVDVDAHAAATPAEHAPDGVADVEVTEVPSTVVPDTLASVVVDNGLVRLTIGEDGTIASLVDLVAERECLAGPGNVLQLFRDLPNTYDAWDVEQHTLAMEPELVTGLNRAEVVDHGPLVAVVQVRRWFHSSQIVQRYEVHAGSAMVRIHTEVDWHEDERLLKAAFPLDIRADEATFDVQYGHVRRPSHRNTSWDAARFEVCGHHWADVSEPDFGVAVLNDGKYGHDVLADGDVTTLRLSLLRAPNYPDPDADRGQHAFTYAIRPHGSSLVPVLADGWRLNVPPRAGRGAPRPSLARADHPGVIITAVKAADDGSGDLVLRAHEALGARAATTFTVAGDWHHAVPCDLAERPVGDPFPVVGGTVEWELRPFKLVTLRLSRSG